MKKIILTLLAIFTSTLTACGASGSTAPAAVSQADPAAGTLSGPTLLILGTLKLEDSGQDVTPEQAADLLPLWKVYWSLVDSDTTAQAEIDALLGQIEDTMTPEQMKAINEMGLTPQDSFAIMQEMGLDMRASRQPGSTTGSGNNNNGFTPPGGGMPSSGLPPEGMPGGGPGMGPGQGASGQNLDPAQIATAQAARGLGGGFNRVSPALLEAFIRFLEERAGS